jgi:hypothetical protein
LLLPPTLCSCPRYNSIIPEPNNLDNPPELCAGGNFSQSYGPLNVAGWSDANCSISSPFMCKLLNPRGIFKCVQPQVPDLPCMLHAICCPLEAALWDTGRALSWI